MQSKSDKTELITQAVYPKARMLDIHFTLFPLKKEAGSLGFTPSGKLGQPEEGLMWVKEKFY